MRTRAQWSEALGLGPLWVPRDALTEEIAADSRAETHDTPLSVITSEPEVSVFTPPDISSTADTTPPPLTGPSLETRETISPTFPALDPESLPSWEALQKEVEHCQRCDLCKTRIHTVFGRGQPGARWLLVGEAPGANEDKQGLAFVGRAGQLLDNMLGAIGLNGNTDAFITNVLKCRPPGNRNPTGDEIVACQHYLHAQIAHLKPTLILALGRFAAQTLLQTEQSISRLRGRLHEYRGIPLIVTFHPAYLLRNLPDKAKAWEDMVLALHTQRELNDKSNIESVE